MKKRLFVLSFIRMPDSGYKRLDPGQELRGVWGDGFEGKNMKAGKESSQSKDRGW
jgi:hypothetical protein